MATKDNYVKIAKIRIETYLKEYSVASNAMIVHTLAETGPNRLDPHIISIALKQLLKEGVINRKPKPFPNQVNIPCYFYTFHEKTKPEAVKKRLHAIFYPLNRLKNNKEETHEKLHKLIGNALEIPVYERLDKLAIDNNLVLKGKIKNYNTEDYSQVTKTEPPQTINNIKIKGWMDFILETQNDIAIIECKNIRQYIYPNNIDFRQCLQKAIDTNTIPVYIARKHHFTINIFRLCGVITHDTQKQIFPPNEADFASMIRTRRPKNKNIIGFHDIAIHNEHEIYKDDPEYIYNKNIDHFNSNLDKFIFTNLLPSIKKARKLFDYAKPFLQKWLNEEISLTELYQAVKNNNNKNVNKIIKPIEDNIEFINKFKMNKVYNELVNKKKGGIAPS